MKQKHCPRCGYPGKDTRNIKAGLAGRGSAKARTREQCQAAARARWSKQKPTEPKETV